MMEPSAFTPARVTVKPAAVNTNWLFTRDVFAFAVLPPIVAAPAAEAVFTSFGATGCFFGSVVVVVVVVVDVVVGAAPVADAGTTVVVVVVVDVDAAGLIGLPANVNSTFVDWLA